MAAVGTRLTWVSPSIREKIIPPFFSGAVVQMLFAIGVAVMVARCSLVEQFSIRTTQCSLIAYPNIATEGPVPAAHISFSIRR